MTTGYTYDSYAAAIETYLPTKAAQDPNFVLMLPKAIDYAELSLYRDLDFLALHGTVALAATQGYQIVSVPSEVIVLEELYFAENVYELDGYGNRILDGFGNPILLFQTQGVALSPLSQGAVRAIYSGSRGVPEYFSVIGAASGAGWTPAMQVLLGPAPDQNYTLLAYVTERQATLSADNETTFISTQLPDLFWAASMIFWNGWIKNFGAMADQPQASVSWEAEYQRLLKSAEVEEARRKFQAPGWTSQFPTPIAAQPRV